VGFAAGWVGYEPGESPEQFLERADRLLYANKRASKPGSTEGPIAHATLS
jgi:PleD family two-component response regulator